MGIVFNFDLSKRLLLIDRLFFVLGLALRRLVPDWVQNNTILNSNNIVKEVFVLFDSSTISVQYWTLNNFWLQVKLYGTKAVILLKVQKAGQVEINRIFGRFRFHFQKMQRFWLNFETIRPFSDVLCCNHQFGLNGIEVVRDVLMTAFKTLIPLRNSVID